MNVFRWPVVQGQLIEHMQHVLAGELAPGPGRQTLVVVLVDDPQHAECLAAIGPVLNEVIGPDTVPADRPQADAGPVIRPEPAVFRLLLQAFQSFAPPYALYPFADNASVVLQEEPVNAPVALTPATGGQANDRP